MKGFFIKFFVLIMILSACSEEGYEVNIKIKNTKEKKAYLAVANIKGRELKIIDSTEIEENSIKFIGKKVFPELVFVKIGDRTFKFFLENSPINIEADYRHLKNVKVSGSKSQNVYTQFEKSKKVILDNYYKLSADYKKIVAEQNADSAKVLEQKIKDTDTDLFNLVVNTIKENPTSYTSLYIALRNKYYFLSKESSYLGNIISMLSSKILESPYGEQLINFQAKLMKLDKGKKAPQIELKTIENKAFKLSQHKAKLTLVDFWASWCPYCRDENPNLVNLYKKHGKAGFTIVAVSLDKDRNKWKEAIKQDGLKAVHVSDLKGWKSKAVQDYLVSGIPSNFLLDAEGKIIAKNLFGEDLASTIENHLYKQK
jgi:thiol-disulfide isomerase/thioredoxin